MHVMSRLKLPVYGSPTSAAAPSSLSAVYSGAGQPPGQMTPLQLATMVNSLLPGLQQSQAQPALNGVAPVQQQHARVTAAAPRSTGPSPKPQWLQNTLKRLRAVSEPEQMQGLAKGVSFPPEKESVVLAVLSKAFGTKLEIAQGTAAGAAGGRGLTVRVRADPKGSANWILGERAQGIVSGFVIHQPVHAAVGTMLEDMYLAGGGFVSLWQGQLAASLSSVSKMTCSSADDSQIDILIKTRLAVANSGEMQALVGKMAGLAAALPGDAAADVAVVVLR